jgi:hypothetical protein
MVSTEALESRLTAVEKDLALLKQTFTGPKRNPQGPWWEKMFGSFADSEGFEEAVRLGKEYRESLRPRDDEKAG